MSHTCSSALVRCMDFRLGSTIKKYMEEKGLYDDCDIISLAGAGKDLAEDANGYLANQIDLSVKLHETKTIILMHHTDCGGYGGRSKFESLDEERSFHIAEMEKSEKILNEKYPELTVKKALVHLNEDGTMEIEEI